MKRVLLIIILFISISSFAAPWDITAQQHIRTLPNVIYTDAFVWDKKYTPSGKDELVITLYFDDYTGNYTSRATVSVYGYYRHSQLGWPQVFWQWEYKQFTVDVPPNTHDYGYSCRVLQTGETFDMSNMLTANGQGTWLNSGIHLESYVQL